MRCIATLALAIASFGCQAGPLPRYPQRDTASLLAFHHVLAETTVGAHTYRVVVAPYQWGECWGKLRSCPDVRLFVVVVPGDLYERASLYRLPNAKAWVFRGWNAVSAESSPGSDEVEFSVETAVPDNNVHANERDRFLPVTYTVRVNATKATVKLIK